MMSSPFPPKNSQRGWIVGSIGSVVFSYLNSKVQSPMGQGTPYFFYSLMGGFLGFGAMWEITKQERGRVVVLLAIAFLISAILFLHFYRQALYSVALRSPPQWAEFGEAVLFTAWTFCLYAVLCVPCRIGGKELIEAFGDIRSMFKL